MTKVVDVRNAGNELVVLGGSLALPVSTNLTPTPSQGAIRFNSVNESLDIYTNGTWTPLVPTSLLGGIVYQGLWNASTNTPTLSSSDGTIGNYYVVSVGGTTNLNGIFSWSVGDIAIFSGTVWNKIASGATVGPTGPTGPAGPTGAASTVTGPTGAAMNPWVIKTSAYNQVNKDQILANTTGGPFTITLEASPNPGDTVTFTDYAGTWGTNNLTVANNGKNIQSVAQNLACNVSGTFTMVYTNLTVGWDILVTAGPTGPSGVTGPTGPTGPQNTNIPVTNTYTSSGAIAPSDLFSLLNSGSALAMTLAAGSTNGQPIAINNYGAGTATVTLNLQGTGSTPFVLPTGSVLNLRWNTTNSTWILAG